MNVRFSDLDGRVQDLALDGFLARIVQHEADHLDGKVFIDKMDAQSRRDAQPALDDLRSRFAARSAV